MIVPPADTVAPDAAEPPPVTQALIAAAVGIADWPSVVACLADTRQEVARLWAHVAGES